MKKRTLSPLSAACVVLIAVTACGGGDSNDDDITLRFAWWGSDLRHQNTQEIIELFEEQNPHITVEAEYGDWDGYWDQLATQSAGGNAPDIIQMDELYLREYADRSSLLELSDVDVSEFDEAAVDTGRTEDGLFAISLGVVAPATPANPDLLEEAGAGLPDDSTWTWDDLADLSAEIVTTMDGMYGVGLGDGDLLLPAWKHQHDGEPLFSEDGDLQLTVEQMQEYIEFTTEFGEASEAPSADVLVEQEGLGPEEGFLATGEAALGGGTWATQITATSEASGTELELLHLPSSTGELADNGEWVKGAMFLSVDDETDHPEEAKEFIEFFVNSQEANEINGMERGLPANLEVRESVLEDASVPERKAAEFVASVEESDPVNVPVPPPGVGEFNEIVNRYLAEVRFGRMEVQDAAEATISELEGAIG